MCLTLIRESITRAATLLKKFCSKRDVSVTKGLNTRQVDGVLLTCTIWSSFFTDSAGGIGIEGDVSVADGFA